MKSSTLLQIALGAGITSVMAPASSAALLLYYSFDNDPALSAGSSINNLVGAVDGTFQEGSSVDSFSSLVASTLPGGNGGIAVNFAPISGALNANNTDFINSNFLSGSLGVAPGTAYTAMAWVQFRSISGDNIIFGTLGPNDNPTLHLGSRSIDLDGGGAGQARATGYHSGHWADDFNTVESQDPDVATDPGVWHHVAFTNNAAGFQEVFVDGVSRGGGANGTNNGSFPSASLILGTASPGDSSFDGLVDEVKIFDTTLTASEIVDASQVAPVPEPSTFLALTGGAAMLLGLRRRRA